MNYKIEIQRSNVTLAGFLSYVKRQCAKKGINCDIDKTEFATLTGNNNGSYYVKDGIKYVTHNGYKTEWDGTDAACKSEILKVLPLDWQTYILNFDGSCYNEICEFTYDDEKRGYGYYYQCNKDADENEEQQA